MKKFILTFALLLSGITLCFADFVGKDQVNKIAKNWFSSENFTVTLDESSTLYYVNATDGGWIHFDYVPGESDVRRGSAQVTGRVCVIGSHLAEDALKELFHIG